MTKIISAPLLTIRNEQHLFLMTEVKRLAKEETAAKLGIEEQLVPFEAALATENKAVEIERGSSITKKLEVIDTKRERYNSGFGYLVEMGLCHYEMDMENAATMAKRVMSKYGNMRRKTNVEETVALRNMTGELLNSDNLPYTVQLGGVGLVTKTQAENEEYSTLFSSRNKESGQRISGNVRDARLVTDPCYNTIMDRINALSIVNGEANYLSFITQLNSAIEGIKTTQAMQDGAKKKSETV